MNDQMNKERRMVSKASNIRNSLNNTRKMPMRMSYMRGEALISASNANNV